MNAHYEATHQLHIVPDLVRQRKGDDEMQQGQTRWIFRRVVSLNLQNANIEQIDEQLEALHFLRTRSSPQDPFVKVLA